MSLWQYSNKCMVFVWKKSDLGILLNIPDLLPNFFWMWLPSQYSGVLRDSFIILNQLNHVQCKCPRMSGQLWGAGIYCGHHKQWSWDFRNHAPQFGKDHVVLGIEPVLVWGACPSSVWALLLALLSGIIPSCAWKPFWGAGDWT